MRQDQMKKMVRRKFTMIPYAHSLWKKEQAAAGDMKLRGRPPLYSLSLNKATPDIGVLMLKL